MKSQYNGPAITLLLRGQKVMRRAVKPEFKLALSIVERLGGKIFAVDDESISRLSHVSWYYGPGWYIMLNPLEDELVGPCLTRESATWAAYYMLTTKTESNTIH